VLGSLRVTQFVTSITVLDPRSCDVDRTHLFFFVTLSISSYSLIFTYCSPSRSNWLRYKLGRE